MSAILTLVTTLLSNCGKLITNIIGLVREFENVAQSAANYATFFNSTCSLSTKVIRASMYAYIFHRLSAQLVAQHSENKNRQQQQTATIIASLSTAEALKFQLSLIFFFFFDITFTIFAVQMLLWTGYYLLLRLLSLTTCLGHLEYPAALVQIY